MKLTDEEIEKGLERIRRSKELEDAEAEKKRQEEEKRAVELETSILSNEEEKAQNERQRAEHPEDICPVCNVHVVDARYMYLPIFNVIICGNCHAWFTPESKFGGLVETLQKNIEDRADTSRITVPKLQAI